ncbi:MAG: hypothetical protein M3O23_00365 [Actinomycetota bacterium]|nr:hypothetical protein [Actinomycetota bacterium]
MRLSGERGGAGRDAGTPAMAAFDRLSRQFGSTMADLRPTGRSEFVRGDWAERNTELEAFLSPRPPVDFLRHPVILYQMFVDRRHLGAELPYVVSRLPAVALAAEDPVGDPPTHGLDDHGVVTSSNTIHHLHHLLRYEDETGRRLADATTVVEWGGGYGNLAKLLVRLHGGAPTYVLIDNPVFAALQWVYLASVLGDDRVTLHRSPGTAVARGKVNVVPLGLVENLEFESDVFVSTWALNESSGEAQRYVRDRQWFGADGLLLAMHDTDPLAPVVVAEGARPSPVVPSMPAQRYFVR